MPQTAWFWEGGRGYFQAEAPSQNLTQKRVYDSHVLPVPRVTRHTMEYIELSIHGV